jgi:hypothetical protein
LDNKIQNAVFTAVARLNEMRDSESRLNAAPETVIAGPDGQLDSMGLINLLLFAEEEVTRALGCPVDVVGIVAERAASSASFTLSELAELIAKNTLD